MSRAKLNMGSISERKGKIIATILAVIVATSAVSLMLLREAEGAAPHAVFGYVTYEDGTPVEGALVNITVICNFRNDTRLS